MEKMKAIRKTTSMKPPMIQKGVKPWQKYNAVGQKGAKVGGGCIPKSREVFHRQTRALVLEKANRDSMRLRTESLAKF